MHETDDDAEFKAFVKQSLISFNANICYLMETLKFTVQRVQTMEASLNIKMVMPVEAESRNLNEEQYALDRTSANSIPHGRGGSTAMLRTISKESQNFNLFL